MPLKMIPASFGQNSISASLAHVPHSFVNISVRVDHSSLAMRKVVHPHAIITIPSFVEHRPSSLFGVVLPISSVLPS